MPRAKLQQADLPTAYFYLQPKFATKEDAEVALEMMQGLCTNKLMVHDKKITVDERTILGQTVMELFQVPNRSVDLETVQGHCEERHFAVSSASSTLKGLVAEGVLYKIGPRTWARKYRAEDDATPAVRPNVDLDASSNGHPAGLEFGEAHQCGCGDAG